MKLGCLIDLHLHLDGSMSLENVKDIAEFAEVELPKDKNILMNKLMVSKDCRSLNEYLEKFELTNELLNTPYGVSKAVFNLYEELKHQGFIYAEVRFAPQKSATFGFTQEEAVKAACAGLKQSGMLGGIILCAMRGNGNEKENMETFEIAKKYLGSGVVGVDLAGAEALFPTQHYAELFKYAKDNNIPITIHAGEADGPDSIEKALDFGATRIGHGVRCIESEATMKRLKDNNITLELCPTSNLNTCVFKSYEEYPIRKIMEYGIKVTINTDNMVVSNTTLKNEYNKLDEFNHFTKDEIKSLLLNSANAAFCDEKTKNILINKINEYYK